MPEMTASQARAVSAKGNLVVMAGAGAGKTRTLIERCLAALGRPHDPVSLDQVLMVTFTEAAAAEMRRRLGVRLAELAAAEPDKTWWPEQLAMLETVPIGTLHSFCLRLIREHFHQLELDPEVTVLDDPRTRLLREETVAGLLRDYHAGSAPQDEPVRRFLVLHSLAGDGPVRRMVLLADEFARSLPAPSEWLAAQVAPPAEVVPARWFDWLGRFYMSFRDDWLPVLSLLDQPNCQAMVAALRECPVAPDRATLAKVCQALRLADDAKWPRGDKGKFRDGLKQQGFFDELDQMEGWSGDEAGLLADWRQMREQLVVLVRLVQEFDQRYSAAKRELGALDFQDLEHLALRVLRGLAEQPSSGPWADRFRLLLVDEYQDISRVQDALLRELARVCPRAERFLVGDVKQSIYRFRLADPHVFQGYAEAWQRDGGEGEVVALSDNFRSHEAIVTAANEAFGWLMRASFGGIAYDELARLRFGDPLGRAPMRCSADDAAPSRVEAWLLPKEPEAPTAEDGSGEARDALDHTGREAVMIARGLRQIHDSGFLVWDGSTRAHRAVRWSDMVVLLRSPRSRAECYARVFADHGLGLVVARRGLFATLEVQDLVNLLRVLDNPQQDLPLLGVLRSPLVGLSPDQLTLVRLSLPKEPFWLALQYFAGQDDIKVAPPGVPDDLVREARTRIGLFLERFARWRATARTDSLSACLEAVLDETAYEAWLLAQEHGAQRQANVARLTELVRQACTGRDRSLYHFLQGVDEWAEVEYDPEPASVVGEDAVRLMSIHQSKGLEFPVVVLAGLGTWFNTRDLQSEPLRDEEYGLCLLNRSEDGQTTWPGLPYALTRNHLRREQYGEELRLLYVGMTRACDRLILAGSANPRQMAQWTEAAHAALPDRWLLRARCALDWLGPWLHRFCGEPQWLAQGQGKRGEFAWRVGSDASHAEALPDTVPAAAEMPSSEFLTALHRCDVPYSWTPSTLEPAKTSVSTLRRRAVEAAEEREHLWRPSGAAGLPLSGKPASGGSASTLSAAERGTAHHRFLQGVTLALTGSAEELRAEAVRMQTAGELTDAEVASLDFAALARFWASELGRKIRTAGDRVHREMPFTVRLTPSECRPFGVALHPGLDDREYLVVQGVVDLVVVEAEEFWLLDFKTDRVQPDAWLEKEAEYRPQIILYAVALQKVLKKPLSTAWLHFLFDGRSVRVSAADAK